MYGREGFIFGDLVLIVRYDFRMVPILTIREGGTVPEGVLSPFFSLI